MNIINNEINIEQPVKKEQMNLYDDYDEVKVPNNTFNIFNSNVQNNEDWRTLHHGEIRHQAIGHCGIHHRDYCKSDVFTDECSSWKSVFDGAWSKWWYHAGVGSEVRNGQTVTGAA